MTEYDEEKQRRLDREDAKQEAKEELREEVKAEVRKELQEKVRAEVREEMREEVQQQLKQELEQEMLGQVNELNRLLIENGRIDDVLKAANDVEYQKKLQDPAFRAEIESSSKTTLNEVLPFSAKLSVYLFLLALVTIVLIAIFPEVRTIGAGKPISMGVIIQMMMLGFGGVILIICKTPVKLVPNGVLFKSGMTACIAIFGIAWMSDTYFSYAMP